MDVNPYLLFEGNCKEAFEYYEKNIGTKTQMMMTHSDAPLPPGTIPAEWGPKIMHASMKFGNTLLMASDAPPGRYAKPQGFSAALSVEKPEEAERIFTALAEGGTTHMPIAETFWAFRFGMLTDKFGIPWMVSCNKPMPPM